MKKPTLSDALAMWSLVLPDFVPTPLNKLMRGKIRDRIRLGKADRDVVAYYFRESSIPEATSKRRVGITVWMTGNLMDPDAPLKGLLDSLKSCGALVDDDAEHLEIGSVAILRGPRRTVIVLEDLTI